VIAIHERSGGIPRVISVICDNALVTGLATDRRPVGESVITEVSSGLALPGAAAPEPVALAARPAPMPVVQERDSLFGAFARLRRFSFF
jgi:hypothetical protein